MLKDSPGKKWLDPLALARLVLDERHSITRVNYYTARVSARAHDPNAPARQATYLSALRTVPEIAIHEGAFMTSKPLMHLAQPLDCRPKDYPWILPPPTSVRVEKSEEKGSDVNLGVHLVRDAFLDAFDTAVVITNDTDLVEPVRIVVQEVGKRVGILVPVRRPAKSLIDAASFYLHIRPGHLGQAQFPDPILRADGTAIAKPAGWVDG